MESDLCQALCKAQWRLVAIVASQVAGALALLDARKETGRHLLLQLHQLALLHFPFSDETATDIDMLT